MGISEQEPVSKPGTIKFWSGCALLFAAAVALRWTRLDLMSFSFDQAAICERAMALYSGQLPFTGIVNSLGFRNAPGYVWTLLPAFLITCNPLVAAAWHGLLCATMVFPLALIGRRLRRDALAWLPAIFAAALPAEVFAGRNLWAQYMVTPLAAWALWALMCALDERRSIAARQKFGAAALGLSAWAMSIHYGAAPVVVIAAAALWQLVRTSRWREKILMLVPIALVFATMLPSFVDYLNRRKNPLPKTDYALKYESMLPDPLPWWARVSDAVSASVANSSLIDVPTLESLSPPAALPWLRGYDVLIEALIIAGLCFCLWGLFRGKSRNSILGAKMSALLLGWICFPVLIGGLFLTWVQSSYFAASLPAGWLAVLYFPPVAPGRRSTVLRPVVWLLLALIFVGDACTTAAYLYRAANRQILPGRAYIPYKWQFQIASYISKAGVRGDHVWHLSGPVFEKPYQHLVTCINQSQAETTAAISSDKYAIVEDLQFARDVPDRLDFLQQSDARRVGPVLVKILPSRGAAEIFIQRYYARGGATTE